MKYWIMMSIDEKLNANVYAEADSKEKATIGIYAPDMQTAKELLDEGERLAINAVWRLQPGKETEELPGKTIEEDIADFEESAQGKRFLKSLENAKKFRQKHDTSGGLMANEIYYLANKTHVDIYNALVSLYDYAYRKGYNKAIKDKKA